MGGVDSADQVMSSIDIVHKSYTWFKKIGFNLIQHLLLNAFLRYRAEKDMSITFLSFSKEAVKHLTRVPSFPKKGHHPPPTILPANQHHMPELIPATTMKKNAQRRCQACSAAGIRHDM